MHLELVSTLISLLILIIIRFHIYKMRIYILYIMIAIFPICYITLWSYSKKHTEFDNDVIPTLWQRCGNVAIQRCIATLSQLHNNVVSQRLFQPWDNFVTMLWAGCEHVTIIGQFATSSQRWDNVAAMLQINVALQRSHNFPATLLEGCGDVASGCCWLRLLQRCANVEY